MEKKIVLTGIALFILVGSLLPLISASEVGGGFGIDIVVGDPDWVAPEGVPSAGAEGNDDEEDNDDSGGSRRTTRLTLPDFDGGEVDDEGEDVQVEIIALNSEEVAVDSEEVGIGESINFIILVAVINVIELLALILLLVVHSKKKKNKLSEESSE